MKQFTDIAAIEKVVDDIHRRQSRQGRAGEASRSDRLVRRPGDEVIRGKAQSASGERSAQVQARHLNVAYVTPRHRRRLQARASCTARSHRKCRCISRCEDRALRTAGGDSPERPVLASAKRRKAAGMKNFFLAKNRDSSPRNTPSAGLASRMTLVARRSPMHE